MLRRLWVLGFGVIAMPGDAYAGAVHFGSYDIETVFFISKSDDHNRVDYGIRLDDHCAPVNNDAVFPYWREFEHSPPVRIHTLGMFEYVPYGFADQHLVQRTATGGDYFVRLKQLTRPVLITTKKEADGHCSAVAKARVANIDGAIFTSVYAKLAGIASVDYIDIHGKHPQTGADLVERVVK
jgi:hypothetical protein